MQFVSKSQYFSEIEKHQTTLQPSWRLQLETMGEDSDIGVSKDDAFLNIDWRYEFSAPKYYNFFYEETESDVAAAERWFESAVPYENSPHVAKTRSISELCAAAMNSNFGGNLEVKQILAHVSPKPDISFQAEAMNELIEKNNEVVPGETRNQENDFVFAAPGGGGPEEEPYTPEGRIITGVSESDPNRTPPSALAALVISPGSLPAKRLYSDLWKEAPSQAQEPRTESKNRLSFSSRGRWDTSIKREELFIAGSTYDSQAQKKQKLEGGRLKQILYMKDRLPRLKDPPTLTVPHEFRFCTDTRARNHHSDGACTSKEVSPFVSMAEKIRRFHMKTSDRFHLPRAHLPGQEAPQFEKPKLKLTVAKEPEFETSQRYRAPSVKSTAELEEEMLANVPKFKARPLPKKILEAPAMPMFTKSTPNMPAFQEFHLQTMERAQHYASNTECSASEFQTALFQKEERKPAGILTKPHPPHLETANRARPFTVKSTEELEEEELAKIPKFKPLPLNKKILCRRDELEIPHKQKPDVTIPHEFHFKTEERAQRRGPPNLADGLLKLSLNQPPNQDAPLRPTRPEPFHLVTDDRGLAKHMKFIHERILKEQEEAKARIPKATRLPSTTDYPEVILKALPKDCTKPEPFQLESLVQHEEKQQHMAEERAQAEQLEAALREFCAQPNFSNAPVYKPLIPRKPLTEIQEFNFQVHQRAIEREKFDKKVAEKHHQYKRDREQYEAARQADEERFLKAMRREMVLTARPMPTFPGPFVPLRSSKQPTRPISPHFHEKICQKERRRSLTRTECRPPLR